MKPSGKVYMLNTFTFIWWNTHWPPQQPQSETRTSCRGGWRPPCPCWPLPLRSGLWGRPGSYEGVYWPLSQLSSTWNSLKDYNLVSWKVRLPSNSGDFQVGLQPAWVILPLCAREAFSTPAEFSHSTDIFCTLMMVCLYYVISEMGSFPMSVSNNFCD